MYRMNTIQAKTNQAKTNQAKGIKAKTKGLVKAKAISRHSMHLRSYTLPPPCTLTPPVLPMVDYGYHQIKRRSNVGIRNVSDSLATLTIARKRANSTSSISSECTQPKRKRIRLMEEVETPILIQSIQPQWPECMTDAELVGLLQMPIVYTLPTGVEESNRDRFIQYIKNTDIINTDMETNANYQHIEGELVM